MQKSEVVPKSHDPAKHPLFFLPPPLFLELYFRSTFLRKERERKERKLSPPPKERYKRKGKKEMQRANKQGIYKRHSVKKD